MNSTLNLTLNVVFLVSTLLLLELQQKNAIIIRILFIKGCIIGFIIQELILVLSYVVMKILRALVAKAQQFNHLL